MFIWSLNLIPQGHKKDLRQNKLIEVSKNEEKSYKYN